MVFFQIVGETCIYLHSLFRYSFLGLSQSHVVTFNESDSLNIPTKII